jgi:hypothetical protein
VLKGVPEIGRSLHERWQLAQGARDTNIEQVKLCGFDGLAFLASIPGCALWPP